MMILTRGCVVSGRKVSGEEQVVKRGWQSLMSNRIDNKTLIGRVARRTGCDEAIVVEIVDAVLEEMVAAFKQGESVSLRNFGTFYVRPERDSTVFRFNPSQRLRQLFGWSSTYKGEI